MTTEPSEHRAVPDSDVRVTCLLENTSRSPALVAEHGLSIWVEARGLRILFDTGQSGAVMDNAQRLGVCIADADFIVLSHGHYDHTGGLAAALPAAPRARLVAHPMASVRRYAVRHGEPAREIGMPPAARAAIQHLDHARIIGAGETLVPADGVGVTGPIARDAPFEDDGGPFFLDPTGTRRDHLDDDQALWVASREGLVVVAGCCHAGVINTLRQAQRASGVAAIRALIGGFHLGDADPARIHATLAALAEIRPALLAPCHCTGDRATEALACAFGAHVVPYSAGTHFVF